MSGSLEQTVFRARAAFSAFLRWWTAELAEMLPDRMRRLLVRPVPVIEVPPSLVLRRSLVLPQAAEATLDEAVAYQLPRLTPFPPDEVRFGCRVSGRDAGSGTVLVDFVAVRREDLAGLLAEVPENAASVTALADGIEIPVSRGAAAEPLPRLRMWAAAGCMALAAIAAFAPYQKRAAIEDELAQRIAHMRGEADAAAEMRRRLETVEARDAFIPKRRFAQPLAVEVLAEVTRLLPDDAWIDYFELRSGAMRVSGHGADAAPMLNAFAESPLFQDAVFSAPITQDAATGLERFDITAHLRGGKS